MKPEHEGRVTLEELSRRGMDNRMQEVVLLLFGERVDIEAINRVTPDEAWAFRYGPLCECGERGLSPDEAKVGICGECK